MTGIIGIMIQTSQLFEASWGQGSTILLEVCAKATILLLFAVAMVLVLRRASAASRHLVWTLALSALLALPVFSLILPAWNVPIFGSYPSATSTGQRETKGDFTAGDLNAQLVPSSEVPVRSSQPWAVWIMASWAIGSALFVSRMIVGEIRVRRIASRSRPLRTDFANSILEDARRRLRISRAIPLRVSPEVDVPFTRGVFRSSIFLPEEAQQWQREQLEFVITHELAHIYRRDCLTQIPAQIACALLWFHPLVWFAAFQMRKERERACDDIVLNLGHPAPDYAEFLLEMGRSLRKLNPSWSTSIAIAQPSQLEVRMKALLDPKLNHKPLTANRVLVIAVLTCALLVPAAAVHATATSATGSISGTVHDPSGAVVPGAGVVLINSKTQTRIASRTGEDGTFNFPAMPVGRYRLEFAKPGFARAQTGEFELGPSRDLHQNYTLDLGWVSEEVVVRGHRPVQAPTAPQHAPRRIRVGGMVQAAKLVKIAKPAYPASAEKQGTEGTVILRAVIGTSGQILSLEPYNDANPALTKAAMDAVRQWQYQPTLLNGVPVEVATTITVVFRLD